jgi:hypothetical protein
MGYGIAEGDGIRHCGTRQRGEKRCTSQCENYFPIHIVLVSSAAGIFSVSFASVILTAQTFSVICCAEYAVVTGELWRSRLLITVSLAYRSLQESARENSRNHNLLTNHYFSMFYVCISWGKRSERERLAAKIRRSAYDLEGRV